MEVCVDHIESALNATTAGAHRLELCSSLMDGGLTPSSGFQNTTRELIKIPLYSMIRPRGGDFCYHSSDLKVMEKDIQFAKANNINGVVFGILTPEGKVDKEACRRLLKIAYPLPATFHRAFDLALDPFEALNDIIGLGFERIATSGQATTALDGLDLITKFNVKAEGRIEIMPACGVTEENLEEILSKSNCKSFHASASHWTTTQMLYQNSGAKMGSSDSDYKWKSCSSSRTKDMLSIAKSVWGLE